jgi:glycosyltransferase involved in cell wall biosynthesis
MKLVIVSATPMYGIKTDEPLEVYEPTLREIESIKDLFEEVNWLGYYKGNNPGNARRAGTKNIHLAALPRAEGGDSLLAKFKILPVLPLLVYKVFRVIQRHDVVHSRGPSVPAFVCIVLSFFFRKKKFWHKYAGNWMEPNPPLMYKVQRWLLMRASNTCVTINGNWPNQPAHIVSLENPSFTAHEREQAIRASSQKQFEIPLTLCFAGLIDASKGVQALIRAFGYMEKPERYIEKLILAGHGPGMDEVKKLTESISVPVEFTGYIQRQNLNEIYKKSHVLLLPSRTEGFPKVVAEAASFGCIPVVTDVSSIGQYVQDGVNGFLLNDAQPESIASVLEKLIHAENLSKLSEEAKAMSTLFTYERFQEAIANQVLT